MNNSTRLHSIDILKSVSILGVLMIHTSTKILEWSQYNLYQFMPTLYLNQLFRFSVPLFILISGFLLESNYPNAKNSYKNYFKKRIARIAVPYIFWSLIYYFLVYTQDRKDLLTALLFGDASYQLYFIPTIFMFYLVFPILQRFFYRLNNPYFLILITSIQIFVMHIDYSVKQFELHEPIRIFILSFLYFLLGMFIAKDKEKLVVFAGKFKYAIYTALVFLGYQITNQGLVGYFSTYNIEAFYSQWRPGIIIYTILIVAISFYFLDHKSIKIEILERISKHSFFVFFVHVIFLEFWWKALNPYLNILPNNIAFQLFFNVLFFVLVSASSFASAYVIHKIRWSVRLTG